MSVSRWLSRSTSSAANFGWNRNADDAIPPTPLLVDSYLNVNEAVFDVASLTELMRPSGLDAFMVYGITTESRGYLFDTALDAHIPLMAPWTDMSKFLPSEDAVAAYEQLGLRERYRLIELAYQPNGYTMLAYGGGAGHRYRCGSRVARNALLI